MAFDEEDRVRTTRSLAGESLFGGSVAVAAGERGVVVEVFCDAYDVEFVRRRSDGGRDVFCLTIAGKDLRLDGDAPQDAMP